MVSRVVPDSAAIARTSLSTARIREPLPENLLPGRPDGCSSQPISVASELNSLEASTIVVTSRVSLMAARGKIG